MSAAVVIPSLTWTARLERCLDSVALQDPQPADVVVVLSKPTGTPPAPTRWPFARVLRCARPPSFCRAVNAGIAATHAPWVLVLNDDVMLDPDFLRRLSEAIPDDPKIGMVCGALLSADGLRIDSTGQSRSKAWIAVEREHGARAPSRFVNAGEVYSVPAAAALYRRVMLETLAVRAGYFDERFGMYLEDLELGCRAQRAGWRAYYVPAAVAWHVRGATAKTRSPKWAWLARYYFPCLAPKLQVRYVLNRYQLMARYQTLRERFTDLPWVAWYEARLWTYLVCCEPDTVRLFRRVVARFWRAGMWKDEARALTIPWST